MSDTIDIQYKLLGAYMNNADLFAGVENLIRSKLFTTAVNQKSYDIIKAYHDKGIKPDTVFIYKALAKAGFDKEDCAEVAQYYAGEKLTEKEVKECVEILFGEYAGEYLKPILKSAASHYDPSNPLKSIENIKGAISNIELALSGVSKDRSIKTQFDEAYDYITGIRSGDIKQAGFSWGLPSLDRKTIGILEGVNIIAAAKGAGKTTMLINIIVENVIRRQLPVLFFSMEMKARDILINVIANIRRINSKALRTGQVDESDLISIQEIKSRLSDTFQIDETGGITHQYFEAKVRAFRKKHKIPLSEPILVLKDYLQLMTNVAEEKKMSKEERIEHICNEQMRICKNENLALVDLSQFSREIDKRGADPFLKSDAARLTALRPRMSDLKGSSAIEANAITIIMLFRPEYYRIYEVEGKNWRGVCEINIAKGRFVNPEPLYAKFTGEYSLLEDEDVTQAIKTDGEDAF